MLPMIMAAAERKAVLGPDDLGAHVEAGGLKRLLDLARYAGWRARHRRPIPGNSAQASRQSARSSLATLPSLRGIEIDAGALPPGRDRSSRRRADR